VFGDYLWWDGHHRNFSGNGAFVQPVWVAPPKTSPMCRASDESPSATGFP
jgi:hypothetical protein